MKPAQGLLAARLLLISILLLSLPAGPAGAATYTVSNLAGDDTTTNGLGYEMNQANGDGYNVNTTINFSSLFNTPQTITTFFTSPNIYKQPGNNLTLTPTVGLLTINGFAGAPFVFQGGGTLSLGNMIIENNASLAIDGSTLALSNVTENGDMSLTNAVTVNTQGTNDSIGGQLYGGGSLTKTGSGALTLSNDGNLQDDTIVRGGTLSVSSDGQMGYTFGYLAVDGGTFQTTASFSSDRFIILGGGTFDVTSGTTLTLTGQLTNGGGLSLTDTGTLVLTNNTNSYTGGTVVGSGSTLSISNDAQLGNSSGNLTLNGGTLETTAGFSSSRNLLLSGGATLDTASGTTDTWNGLVSGTGGLNVTGPGTLVLADSSNSYTGGTAVTGGTLSISADGDLGDSSGNLTLDGGTLQTTSTLSSSRGFSLLAGGGTLNVATATTTTWNGQVGGAGSLTKMGAGTLVLADGSNTYSGGTLINAGTLSIDSAGDLGTGNLTLNGGSLAATSTLTLAQSVTLAPGGGTFNVGSGKTLTLSGGFGAGSGTLTTAGLGTLNLTGSSLYTGDTVLGSGSTLQFSLPSDQAYSGNISGGGNLAVAAGSHTLTLGGTNTYTGTTSLLSGTLSLTGVDALGTGASSSSGLTLGSGTTLGLNFSGTLSNTHTITLSGAAGLAGSSTSTLNNNISLGGTLANADTGTLTLGGTLTGTGGLTQNSVGTLVLTGANSYSGPTSLTNGTLVAGGNSALGTGNLVLNGGTLDSQSAVTLSNNMSLTGNTQVGGSNDLTLNGSLSMGGGATLTDTDTGNVKLGGTLSGTGSLTEDTTGSLTLSGNNSSYTGTITLTDGTLIAGNSNMLGFGGALNLNGGTLESNNNGISLFNTINVNGDAALGGSNAIALSYLVNLGTGDTLTVTDSGAATLTALQGAGNLTLNSTGTLAISNINNGYTGTTTLTNGTLLLGNNFSLGQSVLDFNGGTLRTTANNLYFTNPMNVGGNAVIGGTNNLAWNAGVTLNSAVTLTDADTGAVTFNFNLLGSGCLEEDATGGTLTVSAYNPGFTGDTLLKAGTLRVGNDLSLGTGTLAFGGGTLQTTATRILANDMTGAGDFDVTASMTSLTGDLSGLTSLTKTGLGTLSLAGDTLNSGGITLTAGDLDFDNSANVTFGGSITGAGSLSKSGASTLTLSGANGYSGGTYLGGGTLVVGDPGALGTGDFTLGGGTLASDGGVTLANNGSLAAASSLGGMNDLALGGTLNLNASILTASNTACTIILGGTVSGTGSLIENGPAGTLVLSGDNTYSGGTQVNAGTLLAANASALGTGDVGVHNGGTLQVSAPLTLAIGGNFTESSGGTLRMGLIGGQGPELDVTGTASLAGNLTLDSLNGSGSHVNESVTLLGSSADSGTFDTVTDNVPNSSASLVYNATDVVLDLLTTSPFSSLGATGNQRSVGSALDNLAVFSPGSAFIAYLNSQADADLPGIYDRLSPANLTPLYQMGFATSRVEAGSVVGHLSQLFSQASPQGGDLAWDGQGPLFASDMPATREAALSKDLESQRWGVFVDGLGNFGTVTGDGNGPGYQYSTGGTVAGMDHRFSRNFVGGLLLGYSSSGTSQSTGSVHSTGGQLGLYGGWQEGNWHAHALAVGGVNNYTTLRETVGGTASGSTQGIQLSGELGAGYDFDLGQAKVGPFVSAQYTNVSIDAFTETGSMAPLDYGSQSEGYLSSDLGASASRHWEMGGWSLAPFLDAAWEHVYQGNRDNLAANFGDGNNFTVNGPATGQDAAVLGAGVNALFGKGFSAYARYQGKLGLTNYNEQNMSLGINFGF